MVFGINDAKTSQTLLQGTYLARSTFVNSKNYFDHNSKLLFNLAWFGSSTELRVYEYNHVNNKFTY